MSVPTLLRFWLPQLLYSLLISTKHVLAGFLGLPRIMFPDAVVRFRTIQTCYFYLGMYSGFIWTSDGLLYYRKMQGWHKHRAHTQTHILIKTGTCPDTHTPQNSRLWQNSDEKCWWMQKMSLLFIFFELQGQLLTAALSATLVHKLPTFLWVATVLV